MNVEAYLWPIVAAFTVLAVWDLFHRYFRARVVTQIEDRIGAIEDRVARAEQASTDALEHAKQASSKVSGLEQVPNRWRRA